MDRCMTNGGEFPIRNLSADEDDDKNNPKTAKSFGFNRGL